jgi:hypothetical protein
LYSLLATFLSLSFGDNDLGLLNGEDLFFATNGTPFQFPHKIFRVQGKE